MGKIISFPERQVSQVSVSMKWEANIMNMNAQGTMQEATEFASSLLGSTASVTLSDPYMTGASWAVLFDSAAAYTASNLAAANGILLPLCKEGESGNCRRNNELEIDDPGIQKNYLGSYAHILIKFYYDVAGTRFGLDTYFRVQGFNIIHGKSYPQVQIRGVEPQFAVFNQTLNNYQMVENETLEQNLERISKSFNRQISFCNPPDVDYSQEYIVPVSFRERGVTGGEMIRKYLKSVKGSYLSLPTKEFANKISVCTRANVNQGCSVFYLGVGLYEGYTISGGVEKDVLSANAQNQIFQQALGYQYEEFNPTEKEYTLEDLFPTRRKAKMEKVKKVPFPEQFTESDKKFQETQTSSGFIWKGPGPKVTNTRVTKINLFGISPNGEKAISFLDGIVLNPLTTVGYLTIKTNFFLNICNAGKCVTRPIFQETANLSSVGVGPGQRVSAGEEIGTSTKEKPEFTRLYIPNQDGESITLDPTLVWNFAQPTEGLTDEEKKKAKIGSPQARGSATGNLPPPPPPIVTPAPKKENKDWQTTEPGKRAPKILVMSGHADAVSTNPEEANFNKQLFAWVKRNAANYGIQNILEYYDPPGPESKTQFDQTALAVSQGKQVIEIHLDEKNGTSGVIPPYRGKKIWPLDDRLYVSYGAFKRNYRDNLGVPSRGGTILEVGRQDEATRNIFKNGTPEQKESLYKQLMDPFMRAVATEYAVGAARDAAAAPAQAGCFGELGSTGSSTGPHLHAEWDGSRRGQRIDELVLSKYVTLGGKRIISSMVTSPFGVRRGNKIHGGVDLSGSGADDGAAIGLIGGATLKEVGEKNCPRSTGKCEQGSPPANCCGGGFGNFIVISTPEGDILLAHLREGSLDCARPGTTGSGSNENSSSGPSPGVQTAVSPVGATIETEFNGIPRALRIVPGRTILSFITKYDDWLESGRSSSIDPGVWITKRFSRWIISEADYTWAQGNLRVKLRGVSDWGAALSRKSQFPVPEWEDYLKSEGFEKTKDYFGYIRSLGELCWQLGNGKTSCDVICAEAESVRAFLQKPGQVQDPAAPTLPPSNVTTNFPPAQCQYTGTRYPKDRVNGIINAARQGGINTKAGYAGVVGNAIIESRQGIELNPRAKNNNTKYGFDGCVGIFQWCDRRAGLRKFVQSRGKPISAEFDFNEQMLWFVRELQGADGGGPATVRSLNSQSDPARAAFEFNRLFERAPGQKEIERQNAAREIFNSLDCQG